MLKLKHLFENYDLAKECLQLYDHSENHLDEMLSYFRISSNSIYPFYRDENQNVCFLRLSPIEEKKFQEVESEVHFITWLNDNQFPVMKPYPMKNGKLCDVVKTKWGSYNVSCFQRVLGKTLDDCEGSLELVYGYGKTLGEFHNMSQRYPFANERYQYSDMLNEIEKRFDKYNAPDYIFAVLNDVKEELGKLNKTSANFGLVHYDFEPDNVLFDKKTGQFGVIDLDDSIQCWYALDVCRAIDALNDVVDQEQIEDATNVFLSGYRSACKFTKEQFETIPLMRKLVALESYATILHVLSESIKEKPDWMVEIEEKLNNELRLIEKSL